MGFSFDVSVPALAVFFQGLVSFFSPCVLPLIPLYIGYLSGGTGVRDEDGKMHYKQSKVMVNTFFFVLGVSFAFFILGLGVSVIGGFLRGNQLLFTRIGAIIIIFFGLNQLGIFGGSSILGRERRFTIHLERLGMSPLTALLMGFTFSFAWTPCVGPALASVLLMAASAESQAMGFLLIGVYTLGFVLPFLAVGLFTTKLLELFKKHQNVVKYTVKIGAAIMIFMGILMFTGKMNAITGYLSSVPSKQEQTNTDEQQTDLEDTENMKDTEISEAAEDMEDTAASKDLENMKETETSESAEDMTNTETAEDTDNVENTENTEKEGLLPAIDFTLTDQFGNVHTLSDYKGKTVFLNFWATWCPPCRAEMPDIQKLFEEYRDNEDDSVVILGVAAPEYGQEKTKKGIEAFLEENGYTYPVVMDEDGSIFNQYGIYSYPTTFMIDKEGNVFGYASGQLNEEIMRSIIRQTVEGKRDK